jgi:ribosomal protein S6--L-glutamate ligase
MAVRAAGVLGLGVAGVDMLRSQRGPLVLEVNASPGLEGIETATELDIAGAVIEFVAAATPFAPSHGRLRSAGFTKT